MKRAMGLILLVVGLFVLGVVMLNSYKREQRHLSPIPNNNEVRVILLSPPQLKK